MAGGLGADVLSGGLGADTFAFNSEAESNRLGADTIADFAKGEDRIALNRIDADPDASGNQAFTFLGRGVFTGAGGEVRFGFANGDTLVLADVDGDRRADLEIVLEGTVRLTADEFLL